MTATLPILTFHAIDERSSVISFAPDVFRQGLAMLWEHGYRTLRLLEAVHCLRRGEAFPERSIVITFDDGYHSVFEEAFPVLQTYGMSATVFLTVGERGSVKRSARLPPLEGRSMLCWDEIRDMHQAGIDFGAHTLTHPDLTLLPRDQVAMEICDSKAIIQDMLGVPVSCFAYPFGRYNQSSYEIVRQHFSCASSDKLGLISFGSDPYALERTVHGLKSPFGPLSPLATHQTGYPLFKAAAI